MQEHHARRLHWDFRLERNGVLVSWAVPKGLPMGPEANRLAVPTEDHPLSYLNFAGKIPAGSYGAGTVTIWDSGTYECHKWEPNEVIVTLHGRRVQGRYVLIRTGSGSGSGGRSGSGSGRRGDDRWLLHRMGPPQDPDRSPFPQGLQPMLAYSGDLPSDDQAWGFEIKWDGVRALLYSEAGQICLQSRKMRDITVQYPELRPIGRALGSLDAVLDGEVVAFDQAGRPSFERLQQRMHVTSETVARRLVRHVPVIYVVFDVLWLDGRATMDLPYRERRRLLQDLELTDPHCQKPGYHVGDGPALLQASKDQGLEGVVAKHLDSPYEAGRRSRWWVKVKNRCRQEVVIGGWLPGERARAGRIGALLAGVWDEDRLRYAGRVGSGFTDQELDRLAALLEPLRQSSSPFDPPPPPPLSRLATFVEPILVAEVAFSHWTAAGILRHASYMGMRDDIDPASVVRES